VTAERRGRTCRKTPLAHQRHFPGLAQTSERQRHRRRQRPKFPAWEVTKAQAFETMGRSRGTSASETSLYLSPHHRGPAFAVSSMTSISPTPSRLDLTVNFLDPGWVADFERDLKEAAVCGVTLGIFTVCLRPARGPIQKSPAQLVR